MEYHDPHGVRELMNDFHCFECTEVMPLAFEFNERPDLILDYLCFLPAPRTWLEYRIPEFKERRAILLFDETDNYTKMAHFMATSCSAIGMVPLRNKEVNLKLIKDLKVEKSYALSMIALAHVLLVLINTPRIIGRRQFMPHRGLERDLTRSMGVGKFPLHAWTEIRLEVAKPTEIDDGEPHEAHLTGRRALHFCRAHLRVRLGQLEYVSPHWRGDPALGIKQSRYAVVP